MIGMERTGHAKVVASFGFCFFGGGLDDLRFLQVPEIDQETVYDIRTEVEHPLQYSAHEQRQLIKVAGSVHPMVYSVYA